MKKDDVFYGLTDWERLEMDADGVIERVIGDATDKAGESFDAIADRIEWPIKVLVFTRRDIGTAERIAANAMHHALERLDEEYGDIDGDASEPTEAIKQAALAFGRVVVGDYVSWTCEETGKVIEYTREEIKKDYQ